MLLLLPMAAAPIAAAKITGALKSIIVVTSPLGWTFHQRAASCSAWAETSFAPVRKVRIGATFRPGGRAPIEYPKLGVELTMRGYQMFNCRFDGCSRRA
jgi:hypothetical protein